VPVVLVDLIVAQRKAGRARRDDRARRASEQEELVDGLEESGVRRVQ
jgi:hypothetical protein